MLSSTEKNKPQLFDFDCVILCGGQSKRMRKDKALLEFKSKPLVIFQYERLSQIFKKVYISSKVPYFDIECINDSSEVFSPLVGIYSSLNFLQKGCFFVSVDAPHCTKDDFDKILKNITKDTQVVLARDPQRIHQLIAYYDFSVCSNIKYALKLKQYKIMTLLSNTRHAFADLDSKRCTNMNTAEIYEQCR